MPLLEIIATPVLLVSVLTTVYIWKKPLEKIDDNNYDFGFIINKQPQHMIPTKMTEDELEQMELEIINFCKDEQTKRSKIEGVLIQKDGDTIFECRVDKNL